MSTTTPTSNTPHRRQPLWATDDGAINLAVLTFVLWLGCLWIGVLGFTLPYERPQPTAPPEAPILAQQLQVELSQDSRPPPDVETPPPDPLAPPPPPDALAPTPTIQAIAVAQPSPAIAFALPVEGPTRIVEARLADNVRPLVTNALVSVAPAAPSVQPLTFGQGEGVQPAPDYPRRAKRLGQEGTVLVRFVVDEGGQVRRAEAALPSPWPLLNEAALRAVRERWHFHGGPPRIYEVAIRFELTK